MALPALVQAKPLALTTQLKRYRGDGAYLARYVTDASEYDGISGASVGSDEGLKLTVDIALFVLHEGKRFRQIVIVPNRHPCSKATHYFFAKSL